MQGKYKVVTLCGSTRFKDDFFRVQKELTLEGNIVISVGLFGHSGDDEVWTAGTKEMLDDMHLSKIDMADEIFVVNPGGYVGKSTAREISYALLRGKTVKSIVPIHLDRYTSKEGFSQKILDPKTEAERLMAAQWNMSTKVWNRAITNKLMSGIGSDNIWPIYDGVTLLHKKRCFYSTIIAYLRIFVFVKQRYFSRLTKDSDKLLFVGSVARYLYYVS